MIFTLQREHGEHRPRGTVYKYPRKIIEKYIFLYSGEHSKGQKIPKAIYGILNSSKNKQKRNVYRFWKN